MGKKVRLKIIVPHGNIKRMATHFGVCTESIRRALNYNMDTELASRIRTEAKKNYRGAEIEIPI